LSGKATSGDGRSGEPLRHPNARRSADFDESFNGKKKQIPPAKRPFGMKNIL
jgi:hypothetical protein